MGNVLFVGDLHGNSTHALTLVDLAPRKDCERVFALGDFGAWEHTGDGVRYFDLCAGFGGDHDTCLRQVTTS